MRGGTAKESFTDDNAAIAAARSAVEDAEHIAEADELIGDLGEFDAEDVERQLDDIMTGMNM